jgi:cell division control protein 6
MPRFRRGGTVFRDLSKLSFDYIPEKMVHREKQLQRLFTLLRPAAEAGAATNAYVYGSVGTGKTHGTLRFCREFEVYAREHGRGLEHVYVNCRQKRTNDDVLLAIVKHFQKRFPERGFSVPEKIGVLRRELAKRKLSLLVVLDEVDVLLKKSGADLVYAFTRFGEGSNGGRERVNLILISQRKDALDLMDTATLSTFRRTNVVEFSNYTRDELRDILDIRRELAFHPSTVGIEVLDLVADVAAEYGDARYAIEILEKAGMLADEEAAEGVTAEHVRGAKASVHPTDVEEKVAALDTAKKLALLAIARAVRRRAYLTTGEAERAYEVVCEEYGERKRGHTQFWKYLKELEALGLIDAKISGEGVVGKTTLISLPDVPAGVLAAELEGALAAGTRRQGS